jgi:hypothetical protein
MAREPQFWRDAIDRARSQRPEWPVWGPILASEQYESLFNQLLGEDPDGVTDLLLGLFHGTLAAKLVERGLQTLSYDGHLDFIELLAEAARRLNSDSEIVRARLNPTLRFRSSSARLSTSPRAPCFEGPAVPWGSSPVGDELHV